MKPITAQQFKERCTKDKFSSVHPLVHELLVMDSRIRLNPLFGDVDPEKGFFITKNTIHIPYELPAIQHDIAHLLELTNCKRWVMSDWGMPRFDGSNINARKVFAALSREIRTRAIQLHITRFHNEEEKLRSTAYNQFNNFYWEELVKSHLPFGRFETFQDVEVWMADLRERTYNRWSLDRIQTEWKTRLTYIQNWMETPVCG
jgi:hypothetical protein